ncbi:MAG: tyrosine-type recombinase/integrase [Allosphingosinicella sp.]|uniref:tyrosine-type recombinase/integrase n=1 Tax=Allosphingosinicella sp. TaxID=2823234 RepID=UPI0039386842
MNRYAHAKARQNQLLATDWGALTGIDVRAITDVIARRLRGPVELDAAEAMLALLGPLTAGRSFEEWLGYDLCGWNSDPGHPREVSLQVEDGIWTWLLPVKRDKRPAGSSDAVSLLVQPDLHVRMLCPPLMRQVFETCMVARFGSPTIPASSISLFSLQGLPDLEREEAERMLKVHARALLGERSNARSSTRTLESAERWLWNGMATLEGGDVGTACRVAGRGGPKLVEAQLYYGVTRRSTSTRLQARLLASCGLVDKNLPKEDDGYIGGWRTLTNAAFRSFASHSIRELKSARRRRDPVACHNAMVRHTAAILMVSTGMRPNNLASCWFDATSGFAILVDKRVHDPRARPVPLAEICKEQLRLYRAHLDELIGLVSSDARREIEKRSLGAEIPFFFLDEKDRLSDDTPSRCWKAALQRFAGKLPDNFNRHQLRTDLVELTSCEAIDALLGHWVVGTEPWGSFSGLDPLAYRADTAEIIDRQLRHAGWAPCHGLGVDRTERGELGFFRIGAFKELEESGRDFELRAEPSPFNPAAAQFGRTSSLERLLDDGLAPMPATIEARLGQILTSAILRGALLDRKWFKPFLLAIGQVRCRPGQLWIDMESGDPSQVYGGLRRWFCDPITELLIRRWRAEASASEILAVASASIDFCLRAFLAHARIPLVGDATSHLLEFAEFYWRLRMPGVLASYALGKGPSLSLPAPQWERLVSGRPIRVLSPAKPENKPCSRPSRRRRPERFRALLRHLEGPDAVENTINYARSFRHDDQSLLAHVVRWASLAVRKRGDAENGFRNWGRQKPYSPKGTIANYARALCDLIFDYKLSTDLTGIDAVELDEIYRRALEKVENPSARNRALNSIYSFQSYLCSMNEELDVGDSYEEFRDEGRVSLNVISAQDYGRALKQLGGQSRDARMLRLILTLGFRTGMRLPEILGLRHDDIAEHAGRGGLREIELYLRPHEALRLKTEQSRRMIPLDVLLTERELDELGAWRAEHQDDAKRRPHRLLFSHPGAGAGKLEPGRIRKSIVRALARATGDQTIRFDHLRHSFATHLLVCLLLPRDGTFLPVPSGLDPDCISDVRRDRIIARVSGRERLGRSAVHIVSQLCGHGPVTTSLRWYAHMLDWSLGAFTNRYLLQPLVSTRSALKVISNRKPKVRLESLQRADLRWRTKQNSGAAPARSLSHYRTPIMRPALEWCDGKVHLMAVREALRRSLPVDRSTHHIPFVRRRSSRPRADMGLSSPSWMKVHDAIMANRKGVAAKVAAKTAGVTSRDVKRWLKIGDLISGPRRPGETRMRFQSKMSKERLAKFDLADWRAKFPSKPKGTQFDLVDRIWREATLVIDDADVRWALEEFCRYFSVDTGYTSFLKRKDAQRFYRGMGKMGLAHALEVSRLSQNGQRASFSKSQPQAGSTVDVSHPRPCEWLRWHLAKRLPKRLRPKEPRGADPWLGRRQPRAIAIRINPEVLVGGCEGKGGNHARYAVRFALTMLAILSLEGIRTPPRRRGWIPSYGGYH